MTRSRTPRKLPDQAPPAPFGGDDDEFKRFVAAPSAPAADDATKLSQRDKFIRAARALGCDEDEEAFKRVVRRAAKARARGAPPSDGAVRQETPAGSGKDE